MTLPTPYGGFDLPGSGRLAHPGVQAPSSRYVLPNFEERTADRLSAGPAATRAEASPVKNPRGPPIR